MKGVDFPFTIGYSEGSAVMDKNSKNRFKNSNIEDLLDKGLYKIAFSKALMDNNQEDMQKILDYYNSKSPKKYPNTEVLKKVFGVFSVPEGINKTIIV
ncbi:hypothetical protein [Spirochaeta cellobiosiphila]|uniref:hypothetical protein n=1 Tax=Spirochaeta cellobiosiphila TaxID=504483 RepID=UPI0004071FD6|nr:hypothetical protein [Spirochaeta cellobiosiphila]